MLIRPITFLICSAVWFGGVRIAESAPDDIVYLFTSFRGNGEDGLRFVWSEDGYQWKEVPGTFLKPQVGPSKLMRDPSLVRGADGIFHLVWTTGWQKDQGFGYAQSKDLVHWSDQQFVPAMAHEPTTVNVWAPELFYDEPSGQYIICWASTIPGRFPDHLEPHNNNQRMYYTTTRDFKTFAPTKLFFDPDFSVIDCVIVRDGDRYVLVLKDNTRPEMKLRVAFGDTPVGPWRDVSGPFTGQFTEGPTVLKLGDDWLVYFDAYRQNIYGAVKTQDFKTFTDITKDVSFPRGHKHGTVLRVPRSVIDGLVKEGQQQGSEPRSVGAAIHEESSAERDARMAWWRDARFGLFIHWGVYAVPAGEWKGKSVRATGEWIMNAADIPVAEYEPFAREFNPVKYDPAEWARIAKDAGMKYVVITSKHHDGFSLFDTKGTEWDVVDATPFGKDLLKPLADDCRKQGLKFCTYYSIMDWHHPAQTRGEEEYNPTQIKPERKQEYIDFMKLQLKELLATCNPDVLWFDGEWPDWWTEEDGRNVYAYLRQLKPELIINNRIGKGRMGMEGLNKGDREYIGDFGTPEQQIPATGIPGVDWESCMTMNDTWGYRKDDKNWKSTETLIRNLVDIASKGGNYLLNVGPTAEGEIPPESAQRLAEIGRWMKRNGESIYGTKASPFAAPKWGRVTTKTGDGEGPVTTLYLHVFDWPTDGKLSIPGLQNEVRGSRLLATGKALAVTNSQNISGVTIKLPRAAVDPMDTVIALEIDGPVKLGL